MSVKDLVAPLTHAPTSSLHTSHHHHHHNHHGNSTISSEIINRTAKNREVQANTVKKQWKCGYVECSAKHNWRVTTLFRELMRAVDHVHHGHKAASHRVQEALRFERCVIL